MELEARSFAFVFVRRANDASGLVGSS